MPRSRNSTQANGRAGLSVGRWPPSSQLIFIGGLAIVAGFFAVLAGNLLTVSVPIGRLPAPAPGEQTVAGWWGQAPSPPSPPPSVLPLLLGAAPPAEKNVAGWWGHTLQLPQPPPPPPPPPPVPPLLLGACLVSFVAGLVLNSIFLGPSERVLEAPLRGSGLTGVAPPLVAWVLWLWLVYPVETMLLPKLSELRAASYSFTGDVREHDWNGDNIVSLSELQNFAQVPIVADSKPAFDDSERRWKAGINALQDALRVQVNSIVDGFPAPVYLLVLHMLISFAVVYGLFLAYLIGSHGETKRVYWLSRGKLCWACLALYQLATCGRVVGTGVAIAQNMERNVHMLRKVHQKLSSLDKDVNVFNVLDTVNEFTTGGATGRGKRWGIMLANYRIDQHFTSHGAFNVGVVLLVAVFALPVWWLRKQKQNIEQTAAEQAESASHLESALSETKHQVKREIKNRNQLEHTVTKLRRENSQQDQELQEAAAKRQLVSFEIDPSELSPWPEDQEKGYTEWRKLEQQPDGKWQPIGCFVNGKHLHGRSKFSSEGQFGTVFRARLSRDGSDGVKVAIKCLNVETRKASLTDEVRLFQVLKHQHIVECHGILTEKQDVLAGGVDQHHIVTEFCSQSLDWFLLNDDVWKHKEWADGTESYLTQDMIDEEKCKILLHIAKGISFLHSCDVLHRDIKSQNILLDLAKQNWKICDFGEAKVLKRPFLLFKRREPWKPGYTQSLSKAGRIQKVTSAALLEKGARYYSWILPEEELPPDGATAVDGGSILKWIPCLHGAFVYWFGTTPDKPDPRDLYFEVDRATEKALPRQQSEVEEAEGSDFPQSLPPYGVLPISDELYPCLDFATRRWTLPSDDSEHLEDQFPSLRELRKLNVQIEGQFSPPALITLRREQREMARIPQEATHFVWAYPGLAPHDGGDSATGIDDVIQRLTAKDDTGTMEFLSVGGFVYIQCYDQDGQPDRNPVVDPATEYRVYGANSIGLGLGSKCNIGTIRRTDLNVTARIASPELLNGHGIGLPTDIYAFGILIWEVMTRRVAWAGCSEFRVQNAVGIQRLHPEVPVGLMPDVSEMIRYCLHSNPTHRPTAAQLSAKLYTLFSGLLYDPEGKRALPNEPAPRTVQVLTSTIGEDKNIIVPGVVECDDCTNYDGCTFELTCEKGRCGRCRDLVKVKICENEANQQASQDDARFWFEQTDLNNDGKLDIDELRHLLRSSETDNMSEKELRKEFSRIDTDGNGSIDKQEFSEWFVTRKAQRASDSPLRRRFTTQNVLRRAASTSPRTSSVTEPRLWFSCYVKRGWLIADEHGRQWNTLGKFIGKFGDDPMAERSEPALETDTGWAELSSDCQGIRAVVLEDLGTFETTIQDQGRLGIVFEKGDSWVVAKIDLQKDGKPTLMAQTQYTNIRPGCTLLNVGDTTVRGQTFKHIQPLLAESKRPVRLLWSERIECHFGLDTKDSGKPLGLLFGEKQAGDKFPLVTRVQENSHCTGRNVQGCVLYRIETETKTRLASIIDFKTYGTMSQKRPLTLFFKAAPRNKVGHELALKVRPPRIEEGTPPESPAATSPRSSYLSTAHEPKPELEPEPEFKLEPVESEPDPKKLSDGGRDGALRGRPSEDSTLSRNSSHTTSDGGRSTESDAC